MNLKNLPEKSKKFFKEVYWELKKVSWPNRSELLEYTALVIFITIVVAAFLGALDFIFIKLINKIILK